MQCRVQAKVTSLLFRIDENQVVWLQTHLHARRDHDAPKDQACVRRSSTIAQHGRLLLHFPSASSRMMPHVKYQAETHAYNSSLCRPQTCFVIPQQSCSPTLLHASISRAHQNLACERVTASPLALPKTVICFALATRGFLSPRDLDMHEIVQVSSLLDCSSCFGNHLYGVATTFGQYRCLSAIVRPARQVHVGKSRHSNRSHFSGLESGDLETTRPSCHLVTPFSDRAMP